MEKVLSETIDETLIVTINRPERRNAIDRETAAELAAAFKKFDKDERLKVAILTGANGTFCAGFDLKAVAAGKGNVVKPSGAGPLGPTWMLLKKPVIAAIEGYAVAGGFELALWCDLRVASHEATFGVFNRRFGVPLVDGGTVRLPRLIGLSRALDLILTGRPVSAQEAYAMGIVNRIAEPGRALVQAKQLALQLAAFPQKCLRSDRMSAYEGFGMKIKDAMANETKHGLGTIKSGESLEGAKRFTAGVGRHGRF
jgi:enoyl-CoA hydratase